MTKDDYMLKCKSCQTHWYPKTYTRKEVRDGNCPDCGYKGTPFTGNYCGDHYINGHLTQKTVPIGNLRRKK